MFINGAHLGGNDGAPACIAMSPNTEGSIAYCYPACRQEPPHATLRHTLAWLCTLHAINAPVTCLLNPRRRACPSAQIPTKRPAPGACGRCSLKQSKTRKSVHTHPRPAVLPTWALRGSSLCLSFIWQIPHHTYDAGEKPGSAGSYKPLHCI